MAEPVADLVTAPVALGKVEAAAGTSLAQAAASAATEVSDAAQDAAAPAAPRRGGTSVACSTTVPIGGAAPAPP